jgi:hypothetical protein
MTKGSSARHRKVLAVMKRPLESASPGVSTTTMPGDTALPGPTGSTWDLLDEWTDGIQWLSETLGREVMTSTR